MNCRNTLAVAVAFGALTALSAEPPSRPMKTRVIQPLYLKGEQAAYDCFEWEMAELAKCDASLDLIVLPEATDVQARMPDKPTFERVVAKTHARMLETCSETAKRCKAVVFVNGAEKTPLGYRNTTFAFDTTGKLVGRYLKQQVTAGERDKFGFDVSYTQEWSEPYILEIDGVRYGFLTCYDFYYYENYSNIARAKPDIVIGCSHQRSDKLEVLEFINSFCAYNTAAYLVRSSVSMGLDSPLGGSSMVVAPDGKILGNMKSSVGVLDVTIDPFKKYLKPAGYGNPLATHPAYVEIGRRPWKYRPGGSAIVPGFDEAPAKRLIVHRGLTASAPECSLPALASAVAVGAEDVEFDLRLTKDGVPVVIHDATVDRVSDGKGAVAELTLAELRKLDFGIRRDPALKGLRLATFEDVLRKLSCHARMIVHVKGGVDVGWNETTLAKVAELVHTYDADGHVSVISGDIEILRILVTVAPKLRRGLTFGKNIAKGKMSAEELVAGALTFGCRDINLPPKDLDRATVELVHAKGLRCLVWAKKDLALTRHLFDLGVDAVFTDAYLAAAEATGTGKKL